MCFSENICEGRRRRRKPEIKKASEEKDQSSTLGASAYVRTRDMGNGLRKYVRNYEVPATQINELLPLVGIYAAVPPNEIFHNAGATL